VQLELKVLLEQEEVLDIGDLFGLMFLKILWVLRQLQ
jgi:hypothetical protein